MARIIGDNNNNQLFGTREDDRILGLGGDDFINGRNGDDIIIAGAGDDRAQGRRGDDTIRGQAGNDNLRGGGGNDRLRGGDDNDILGGGSGDDILIGDAGDDIMRGGGGDDRMIWNPGDGDDIMRGGSGDDTAVANGGSAGEIFTLLQNGRRAIFDRVDPFPFNLNIGGTETVELNAGGGDDSFTVGDLSNTDVVRVVFNGGDGNDTLDASETTTQVSANGGAGDDTLIGGDADDLLQGGDGNDVIDGDRGDDIMLGGAGDDRMIWNPGGGSDAMVGGDGTDTAAVNGGSRDEQFTLRQENNLAIFDRVNPGPFTLTITESEVMELNGNDGNDSFEVSDVSNTDLRLVIFNGGLGNDVLNAAAAGVEINADGGDGDDTLIGGSSDDTLTGGAGVDDLTGGLGRDRFVYGSNALGTTDRISDYEITNDQYVFNGDELGIDALVFQNALPDDLAGNSNIIILQQGFANAGAAAQAIADNDQVVSQEGAFVYFNETFGIGRLVHSQNLSEGGEFNVLANMENITDVADLANFTADNFALA